MDVWSWDNRAKIYLYNNAGNFHNDPQHSEWAGAVVSVENRTIKTFVGQEGFLASILQNEMKHILFREFIGAKASLPLMRTMPMPASPIGVATAAIVSLQSALIISKFAYHEQ